MDAKTTQNFPTLGRWTLTKLLGTGGTAQVFLGIDSSSNQLAAVKVFTLPYETSVQFMKSEAEALAKISHPNVISLTESFDSIEIIKPDCKKTSRVCAISMEYAPRGCLFEMLESEEFFLEDISREFFRQLISAISHLHSKKIAHGDVKLDNLLLDGDFNLKLADFGHSMEITDKYTTEPAGTSSYYAPEIHAKVPYAPEEGDLFACGIVLFAMVAGHMPFKEAVETDKLYNHFYKNKQTTFWEHHERLMKSKGLDFKFSSNFKDLCEKMLHRNPRKRLTLADIQAHPWMKARSSE